MPRRWRTVVTALLTRPPTSRSSSAGGSRRRLRERLPEGLGLLVGQVRIGRAAGHGLRVQACAGAGVEAADDEPIASAIEQCKGEALVAAGVLERVEPHEPHSPERALEVAFDHRGPSRDLVDIADDLSNPLQVAAEDGLERLVVAAPGDALEPPAEGPNTPDEPDHRQDEGEHDDQQPTDDETDVGGDERVEVDQTSSRAGQVESSVRRLAAAHPVLSFAAMAKRTRGNRPPARSAAKRTARPATPASGPFRATPRLATDHTGHDHADHTGHDHGDGMPVQSSSSLTEAEIARAAELEAEANARERAAIADSLRRRARGQANVLQEPGDINAPLSVRAAHEYAYVARDVKRIALTASLMVAILAVLHILVNVTGVITL